MQIIRVQLVILQHLIFGWGSLVIDILRHEKLEVLKEVTDFLS